MFTFIDGLWRKMIYVYLLKDIKELFYDTYTACYEGNTDGLVALIYNLYGINLNKDTLELTLKRLPTSEDKITVIKARNASLSISINNGEDLSKKRGIGFRSRR